MPFAVNAIAGGLSANVRLNARFGEGGEDPHRPTLYTPSGHLGSRWTGVYHFADWEGSIIEQYYSTDVVNY